VSRCIVKRGRCTAKERAGKGAALQLVPPGCWPGRAPLPGVTAQVVDAVLTHAAGVGTDRGGVPNPALTAVALGRGALVAPRVDVTPGASGGLLPLLRRGQRLACPLAVSVRVMPRNEYDWVV